MIYRTSFRMAFFFAGAFVFVKPASTGCGGAGGAVKRASAERGMPAAKRSATVRGSEVQALKQSDLPEGVLHRHREGDVTGVYVNNVKYGERGYNLFTDSGIARASNVWSDEWLPGCSVKDFMSSLPRHLSDNIRKPLDMGGRNFLFIKLFVLDNAGKKYGRFLCKNSDSFIVSLDESDPSGNDIVLYSQFIDDISRKGWHPILVEGKDRYENNHHTETFFIEHLCLNTEGYAKLFEIMISDVKKPWIYSDEVGEKEVVAFGIELFSYYEPCSACLDALSLLSSHRINEMKERLGIERFILLAQSSGEAHYSDARPRCYFGGIDMEDPKTRRPLKSGVMPAYLDSIILSSSKWLESLIFLRGPMAYGKDHFVRDLKVLSVCEKKEEE